jgi:glutamate-ammonia-ligase adenylyltransferase
LLEYLASIDVITVQQQQALVDNYCKLRDFSHQATLQNSPAMIPEAEFSAQHNQVMNIVKSLLH